MNKKLLSSVTAFVLICPLLPVIQAAAKEPAALLTVNTVQTATETNFNIWLFVAIGALVGLGVFFWMQWKDRHKD